MTATTIKSNHTYDVVIVGGGAAGVGVAITLGDADIHNVLVLERHSIGASFHSWPAETRFITPSFPSNSIGMLDMNSVAIGTSIAYSMGVEHPTGREYAFFLNLIAMHFEVPVCENTDVTSIVREGIGFTVETSAGTVRARNVIWAAGDFQ
ncbi:MAG: NAD(P)-binding domain-containing protein, partial [Acidobacteriota bacterium]